jgi:gamma-glutamylcyclotransferase (GGCT)/AIG2-like uncharacterized protein YtfP
LHPSCPGKIQRPIFVYGTLRRREKNHQAYLAGRYSRCRPATVRGHLFFEPRQGYPYLLAGDGIVRGELFDLKPESYTETLARLDALEEYDPHDEAGSVYLRRLAEASLEDGSRCECWTYYWNGPSDVGRPVPGDDFQLETERRWR